MCCYKENPIREEFKEYINPKQRLWIFGWPICLIKTIYIIESNAYITMKDGSRICQNIIDRNQYWWDYEWDKKIIKENLSKNFWKEKPTDK